MQQGRARRIGRSRAQEGFSLLELIIVITVIGVLATIALPNLLNTPRRADEAVLKTNLRTLRETIDQHNGDKGYFPASIEALVDEGYLRDVPYDPIYEAAEWGLEYEEFQAEEFEPAETDLAEGGEPGIIDVYSLSEEESLDGQPYSEW
ncbi:MAG: prepilin-type N-terminal cleavage/methylation domain-containing protein [Acidobacteriota bacterium]